jgi:hypothetical protein
MPVESARRRFVPVRFALAVLLLTAAGGGAGYLAATRQLRRAAGAGAGPSVAAGPGGPSVDPSGARCPRHTEQLAGISPLREVLYLRTAQAEVWICEDAGGTRYYQGHRGAPGEDLVEGSNALFLDAVQWDPARPDRYIAINIDQNGTTLYIVSPTQLVQVVQGAQRSPEPAVTSRVG